MRARPRLILTGASGFVGRRFLEIAKRDYSITVINRRSQAECRVPNHRNIKWHELNLASREELEPLFRALALSGGADYVVHLAAYFDFTGEDHPEYHSTNVEGLRNILELSRGLGLHRFVFASSVAACSFPPAGEPITEQSPPDGSHPYSVSKRVGEEMLRDYLDHFPSVIVRFGALFSDWCEYPPLYFFLKSWLAEGWTARILGGRGLSAVPYLHVNDTARFLLAVLARAGDLDPVEVLLASTDGAVTHRQLFEAATASFFGSAERPIHMPKSLARPGMWLRDLAGRAIGSRPFERPWMARYIDRQLSVDARRTRARIGWQPHPRLDVLRRMPFLVENMKTDPGEWYRRNHEVMEELALQPNLRIHRLLEVHHDEIVEEFLRRLATPEGRQRAPHAAGLSTQESHWHASQSLRNLVSSVRTREKGVFMAYCRDLAEHCVELGFGVEEICYELNLLGHICCNMLRNSRDPGFTEADLRAFVTMTVEFGVDQVHEICELAELDALEEASAGYRDHLWGQRRWESDEPAYKRADFKTLMATRAELLGAIPDP